MDTFSKEVIKLLAGKRDSLGITQQETANALGVSVRVLDAIERGVLPISLGFYEQYCEHIGTGFDNIAKESKEITMTAKDYQRLAMRTNDKKGTDRLASKVNQCMSGWREGYDLGGLLNGVLGLTGEAGEFADIIKKWVFHEKELDESHAKKELGDVMWYIAMICESFDWSLEEILDMNIDKLIARYPIDEGFTVERANHRKEGDV